MRSYRKNFILTAVVAALVGALISAGAILLLPKLFGGASESEEMPTVDINTPYCVMKYPSEWTGLLGLKEEAQDDFYSKTFCCNIAGGEYNLFTIFFGEPQKGDLFGYVKAGETKIPVYVQCYPLPEDSTLTPQEKEIFYAMMDGINQVTESIASAEGYSAG